MPRELGLHELLNVFFQLRSISVARREHDERLDDVAPELVGLAYDPCLDDCGMLNQGALDLERSDPLTSGLDHIVGAPDIPEVAVLVNLRGVARVVPAVPEVLVVLRGVLPDLPHHSWPARSESQAALLALLQLLAFLVDDCRLDARKRLAHRARLDVHLREVRDQYAASLRLPPSVVEWLEVEDIQCPLHSLGIQRFADRVVRPQA